MKSTKLIQKVIQKTSKIRNRSTISAAEDLACPKDDVQSKEHVKPYSEVPGPKPLPILGNTGRLLPLIGRYDVSDVAKLSSLLYEQYGTIVKLSGLIGRPDLLFVYDCDEIEKVIRQEGPTPFRPSMPCLVKYKSEVRREFFEESPGVVGVYVYKTKMPVTC